MCGEHAPHQDLGSLAIMEKFAESLDRRLQFRHEIDRADSVLRNATPRAVMQVPALSSRDTSHARALWQLSGTDFDWKEKSTYFFWKNLQSCVREPKKLWWPRLLA